MAAESPTAALPVAPIVAAAPPRPGLGPALPPGASRPPTVQRTSAGPRPATPPDLGTRSGRNKGRESPSGPSPVPLSLEGTDRSGRPALAAPSEESAASAPSAPTGDAPDAAFPLGGHVEAEIVPLTGLRRLPTTSPGADDVAPAAPLLATAVPAAPEPTSPAVDGRPKVTGPVPGPYPVVQRMASLVTAPDPHRRDPAPGAGEGTTTPAAGRSVGSVVPLVADRAPLLLAPPSAPVEGRSAGRDGRSVPPTLEAPRGGPVGSSGTAGGAAGAGLLAYRLRPIRIRGRGRGGGGCGPGPPGSGRIGRLPAACVHDDGSRLALGHRPEQAGSEQGGKPGAHRAAGARRPFARRHRATYLHGRRAPDRGLRPTGRPGARAARPRRPRPPPSPQPRRPRPRAPPTATPAAMSDRDVDRLARRLYPRLRDHLRGELRLDRERLGRASDLGLRS